jgi:hypothetical protein
MEVKGTVEQVSSKDVNTKWGLKKTYSVKVNGSWVSCGFKDPKVSNGDVVQCEAESTTYGLQTKAVSKLADGGGGPATPPAASRQAFVPSNAKVFPVPPLHGDRSIIRQNVLARATDLFIAARGGKPYDVDLDETSIFIIQLARKFEAYATGDIDMAQAKAALNQEEEE